MRSRGHRTAKCKACGRATGYDDYDIVHAGGYVKCPHCGAIVKLGD